MLHERDILHDCPFGESRGIDLVHRQRKWESREGSPCGVFKPPRFVMALYNTHNLDSLERKWLFDHTKAPRAQKATAADDGDLVKAARSAKDLWKDFPDAEFVVYLCTNRVVDHKIMVKVYRVAEEFGVTVICFGQSRIRDCLDMRPEGQWLRKEHLGIDADLLSLSLLRSLSLESLSQYGNEFLFTAKTKSEGLWRDFREGVRRRLKWKS